MEIEGYLLGSPPPVGPSFEWPPPLFGARLTPSLLPLLPAHSPHSQLTPLDPPFAPSSPPRSQWPREGRGMFIDIHTSCCL